MLVCLLWWLSSHSCIACLLAIHVRGYWRGPECKSYVWLDNLCPLYFASDDVKGLFNVPFHQWGWCICRRTLRQCDLVFTSISVLHQEQVLWC